MAQIVDSYTNYQGADYIGYGYRGTGQSFTGDGGTLNSASFYIQKAGTPTGNIYVRIYGHTGTYGTSSVSNGTTLATSDAIDISTISSSISYVLFTFSGANKITLVDGTYYVVAIEWTGNPGTSDGINVGFRYTSPTHSGNRSNKDGIGVWSFKTSDNCFYVYKDDIATTSSSSSSSSISSSSSSSSSSSISTSSSSSSVSVSTSSSSSSSSITLLTTSSSSSSSSSISTSSSSSSISTSSSSSISFSTSSSSLSTSSSSISLSSSSSSSSTVPGRPINTIQDIKYNLNIKSIKSIAKI